MNVIFCCGNDGKCAGNCECQCHGLLDKIERLKEEVQDLSAPLIDILKAERAEIKRLCAGLERIDRECIDPHAQNIARAVIAKAKDAT